MSVLARERTAGSRSYINWPGQVVAFSSRCPEIAGSQVEPPSCPPEPHVAPNGSTWCIWNFHAMTWLAFSAMAADGRTES